MSAFQSPVSMYMSSPVLGISPTSSLEEAWSTMQASGVSALVVRDPVTDTPLGMVRREDLLRVGRLEAGRRPLDATLVLPERPVSDELSHNVPTVSANAPLAEAAARMVQRRTHRVLVMEGERCVGVLTTRDLMQVLEEQRDNHPVSDFMSHPVFTVRSEEPVSLAVERLERARVTGLVVVENDWPVGIFTQVEALESRDRPRHTPVEEAMSSRILTLRSTTPLHRAAAQAGATRVRRVIVQDDARLVGILTGLDFARALG